MRKRLWLILWSVLLLSIARGGITLAQDKSLYWQRYDVNITVQPNSDMLVEEIQQIRFTSGVFRFGFASIPTDRVEAITDVSVSELTETGERAYQRGSSREYGFVVSTTEDALEVTWYFPPTSNSAHTYILRYRVVGGLRFYEGGDQVWWKAIAPDHNFPIQSSRVSVSLPKAFGREELLSASYGAPAEISYTPTGQVVFSAQNIPADTELEVRVQFPHGAVQGEPPAWQASFDRRQQYGPLFSVVFGGLGLALAVGGPLAIYLLWHSRGRDRPSSVVPEYVSEPPSDLPAGVVGTLVDENVDMKDIVASILDLARRGALRIEEQKRTGFLGIGSGSDFVFHLADRSKATRQFELTLLDKMFEGGISERKLSDLRNKFYTIISELRSQLYQEVVRAGFFPGSPQSTRQKWVGLGVFGLVVAGVLAFALLALLGDYSPWVACPGASLAASMIGLMIVGMAMPRKTPQGAEEAAKWLAFKRYLQSIEQHSDLQVVKDKFEEFLPYAVAFGLERRLIQQFSAVDAPAPSWWGPVYMPGRVYPYPAGSLAPGGSSASMPPGPLAGEGGSAPSLAGMSRGIGASLASMSAGLGDLLNSAGSVLTSAPSSSSRSGGGGWSGGGFSGGGGGGGGSRGFG